MWPRWKMREYSLLRYLRECVWGLEKVESRINMLRHAWSTPCFILEEDEPEEALPMGTSGPRSCLVPDSEDDDSPPVCLRNTGSRRLSCIPSMDGDDDSDDDDDDDNDDDDSVLYTRTSHETHEAIHSDDKSSEEPGTPPPTVRVTPADTHGNAPNQRPVTHAPHEAPTLPRRPRVLYRTRKISLPIPIRIPENTVAHHHTRYYTPMPTHMQRPPATPTPRQVRRA